MAGIKILLKYLTTTLSTNAARLESTIKNFKSHSCLVARREIALSLCLLIIHNPHFLI